MNKYNYQYRWSMLTFCIWIPMGNYYNYDIPTSLYNSFKSYLAPILSDNQFEFYYGLLFSITSFVNIFTPFISGSTISSNQLRIKRLIWKQNCLIRFVISSLFGIIHLHPRLHSLQPILYHNWSNPHHHPNQSAFLILQIRPYFVGLCELFASFGTISVMYFAPKLAAQYDLIFAIQSGSFAIAMSVVCCIITIVYDLNAEYVQQENQIQNVEVSKQMKAQDHFPFIYWMIILYNMLLFGSLLTFSNFSVGILTERWYADDESAEEKAGKLMAIMWAISSFLTPVFGYLIDKYKNRAIFNICASCLGCFGLVQLWYYAPFIAINLLGISYAIMCASVWSSIVYIIDEASLGTGYAYLLSSCNFLLSILPLSISLIKIRTASFFISVMMLAVLIFITVLLGIYIYIVDNQENNSLDGKILPINQSYDQLEQEEI
ncbi:unnamed protein product (macronuclear) [Paramecium tetraurelia]|uniref:Major facilitator superfamily (MFS) profile domain-containing protein n=1 Tax=Paramecium tetraurelia TaxID=5888 RepID=A0CUS0_PARTE|nr:uncharacterized protein GSPATT00010738001 [Paramecium tetraurelia]CAK74537.1 unnamed protein product [Paramecium tetraurelia]|eukprot:XP_001441934.1 hypothetical protein (macronuclear) [Paramecium tetraurelia strain d4-2]